MKHQDIERIFAEAYARMDEPVIDGNCGTLCGYHCCREADASGERMGIYLLPFEYEAMIQGKPFAEHLRVTTHSAKVYEMPPGIRRLYFVYCRDSAQCLRNHRPIQCRTYPFEPYLEKEALSIIVPKQQLHQCPLLKTPERWRPEFIRGVFEGWRLLTEIPAIRSLVAFDSRNCLPEDIEMRYSF